MVNWKKDEILDIVRTYNSQFDASYINYEFLTTNKELPNISEDDLHTLMLDPYIMERCKDHLIKTLANRSSIIWDYWMDGIEANELREITGLDMEDEELYDHIRDLAYGDEEENQQFIKLMKSRIDESIEWSFNKEHIENYEVNWGITFIN